MHRSGTSVVAGSLAEMGLRLPNGPDLMPGGPYNPRHNESLGLTALDEALLARAGGTWDAPGPEGDEWVDGALDELSEVAGDTARRVFAGSGPLVWKDPRLCLVLPFWRRLLPAPTRAVFVWRAPLAVARSLQRRDGFSPDYGLRLWERHVHDGLRHLAGMPTFFLRYELLVADPEAVLTALAGWLGSQAVLDVAEESVRAASALVSPALCHEVGDGPVPRRIRAVVDALEARSSLPGPGSRGSRGSRG